MWKRNQVAWSSYSDFIRIMLLSVCYCSLNNNMLRCEVTVARIYQIEMIFSSLYFSSKHKFTFHVIHMSFYIMLCIKSRKGVLLKPWGEFTWNSRVNTSGACDVIWTLNSTRVYPSWVSLEVGQRVLFTTLELGFINRVLRHSAQPASFTWTRPWIVKLLLFRIKRLK